MSIQAAFSDCTPCCLLRFQHLLPPSASTRRYQFRKSNSKPHKIFAIRRKREVRCSAVEADENEPEKREDEGNEAHADREASISSEIGTQDNLELGPVTNNNSLRENEAVTSSDSLDSNQNKMTNTNEEEVLVQAGVQDEDKMVVASGSPLPGVKSQQFDESARIPKATIDILRDQVFGFDTFFVTGQEPYEGGVLFKGNLRGKSDKSYEKITKRMKDKFGDEYKVFLLVNPEDDKPVAVVVPRKTLQPENAAVPEWFAAASFGLVTLFTLLLRNVPALQSNLLSMADNIDLLKDGLPGALVTALILGTHEISQYVVANNCGVKLGIPYFVPSWQIGSFGAITRIINIVPKREDLIKVAAAGPLAGFSLGLILLLLGFILPPSDGIGTVVDASVFHESFLVGGIAKLLLGGALKEGTPISLNPLVIWAWAGLLINAINSIPAGEIDGGRISFAIWGRKAASRITGASIALLGLSSLFNDVAFYWVVLIFILQRGPIAPLSEEVTDPDNKYVALGISVLIIGLLVCLPYPFMFSNDSMTIL